MFEKIGLFQIYCGGNDSDEELQEGGDVATIEKSKNKRPKRYKVLLHNDDYTTMEFVILVLQKFFHKDSDEAMAIMLKIHNEGFGICGVYSYEIAESKSYQVNKFAKDNGHPLKSSIEVE